MGLRFRKSIRLMPGVRVNFSLKSASISIGAPGATYGDQMGKDNMLSIDYSA